MSIKPLNSIAGFSVGEYPSTTVINSNGNVTTANLSVTALANLGAVANVAITGGSAGQVIQTDGAGNLSFVTLGTASLSNGNSNVSVLNNGNINFSVAGNANVVTFTGVGANFNGNVAVTGLLTNNLYYANGTPWDLQEAAGANTQIQYNNGTNNNFGASANFTFNDTTNVLTVTGNIVGTNIYANSGIIGAQTLKGEGGNISNIQGGNVSGAVAFATTANSVAGGNVSGQVANAAIAGTVYTAAQPNITSVGTLVSLDVTGNLAAGNISTSGSGGNITMSGGNITGANVISANLFSGNGSSLSAIAGGNVTGQVANALVAGTVYTNAQPNITSVGTLSSLAVTGNISGGNVNGGNLVTANFVAGTLTTAAQPNITSVGTLALLDVTGNIVTSANLVTNLIVGQSTGVSITATGTNQNITLVPTGTGNVNVSGKILGNLATPVASTDAATKQYVDDVAQGLNIHDSCQAATPATLASISGGTVTYDNGTAGVGATLTTTGSYTTIDGVTLSNGNRILVKNEVDPANNGIYVRTSATVLTRATDYNSVPEIEAGDFVFITGGTLYDNTGWVQTSTVTTVGTDPIDFVQFSGAGTYTAGTGLTLTGSQFSITNTAVTAGAYGNGDSVATFTVNSQGQLTAAANVVITANAANLSGTTLNANIVNSSLTSVGTLGNLAVTANVVAGNVYANSGTIGANLLAGTLTTAAQPNITSLGNLTGLVVGNASANVVIANVGTITSTGNITAPYFIGNVQGNISGNIVVPGSNGEVIFNNAGNAGASNAFSFNTSSNVLTVTGNISATAANLTTANVTGNVIIGNSTVSANTVTTSSTSLTTIASFPVSGVTGVEFLVKGVDVNGVTDKYSVATVSAVTDGASADYSVYGGVTLGGYTGALSVSVSSGSLRLQVTPSSSNSTVWTTQYRFI
jgi:hypothetical protein